MEVQIHIQERPWAGKLGIWLQDRAEDGTRRIAAPVVFAPVDMGVDDRAPSAEITHAAAQHLMEQLWRMGIRPRDGEGTMAHVEAMKNHIEDLRRMAFKSNFTALGPGAATLPR